MLLRAKQCGKSGRAGRDEICSQALPTMEASCLASGFRFWLIILINFAPHPPVIATLTKLPFGPVERIPQRAWMCLLTSAW